MIQDPEDASQIRERLLAHVRSKTSDTLTDNYSVDCHQFQDNNIFEKEIENLKKIPILMKSQSFAPKANSYLSSELLNVDLLQWTDPEHKTQVFANTCRHRGSKLCLESEGEASHLACPYHSWTYNSSGCLQNATNDPKANEKKNDLSLIQYKSYTVGNFHWVTLDKNSKHNAENFLSPIIKPLQSLKLFDSHSVNNFSFEVNANWKLSVASFLETYHFKAVHQKTLGALKHHNVNLIDYYSEHLRITVPLNPFFDRINQAVTQTHSLLEETNLQYFIFPNTFLLIYNGHFAKITILPITIGKSLWTYEALVPHIAPISLQEKAIQSSEFLYKVEQEDVVILENSQRNIQNGVLDKLCISVHEPALRHFYESVKSLLH